MNISLKAGLTAFTMAVTLATGAVAADWTPPGPITMKISFAAGGGADTQGRLIAAELEDRLGWSIIPENLPGRGGLTAAADLIDDPADGTVIMMGATETFGYGMLTAKTGWKPASFTPIVTTAGFQMGLVAASSKGWKTVDDMFAAAKSGETIRFGSLSARLADLATLLGEANGVDFNIVDIKGGGPLMNAMMAGDVDVGFVAGAQTKRVLAGELVNLASALSTPLVATPDAPLLLDRGLEFNSDGYFYIAGPAGLPDEARDAIANAVADIVSDPANPAGAMIKKAFGGPGVLKGAELDNFMQAVYDDAGKLIAVMNQ